MELVEQYPYLAEGWLTGPEGRTCREVLTLVRTFGWYDDPAIPESWWVLAQQRAVELQLEMRWPSGTYIAGEVLAALGSP